MSNINTVTSILREPFCDNTRKTRRNLLITSLIGILISKIGLVPQEISILNIKLTANNQESLALLLIVVISFFLLSFITYFINDFNAGAIDAENTEYKLRKQLMEKENSNSAENDINIEPSTNKYIKPGLIMRVLIDIVAPIFIALYTAYSLYFFEPIIPILSVS